MFQVLCGWWSCRPHCPCRVQMFIWAFGCFGRCSVQVEAQQRILRTRGPSCQSCTLSRPLSQRRAAREFPRANLSQSRERSHLISRVLFFFSLLPLWLCVCRSFICHRVSSYTRRICSPISLMAAQKDGPGFGPMIFLPFFLLIL